METKKEFNDLKKKSSDLFGYCGCCRYSVFLQLNYCENNGGTGPALLEAVGWVNVRSKLVSTSLQSLRLSSPDPSPSAPNLQVSR
jgi:hypothetical protein